LYQVATGLLSDDEISGPLRSIVSPLENVDVFACRRTLASHQHTFLWPGGRKGLF
jgi:hypothetical protein